jgi:Protein of unknown function (DUF3179)
MPGREPVVALQIRGEARAYPIRILIWHEIVNDTVASVPVAVAFCPLCHTAIAFDRRVVGRTLTFGTTGNLRFSDRVMWDRQTESWWQQFGGAIVGRLTGARLRVLPSQLVSHADFIREHPRGLVLSQRTGFDRPYGQNPYPGYDRANDRPFLLRDRPLDGRLPPKARVVIVGHGGALHAYPLTALADRGVVDDLVGDLPVVVWWRAGVVSALGRPTVAGGADVGSAVVFDRRVGVVR